METVQAISRLMFWLGPALLVTYGIYKGEYHGEGGRTYKDSGSPLWRGTKAMGAGVFVLIVWTMLLGSPDVLNGILAAMSNGQR